MEWPVLAVLMLLLGSSSCNHPAAATTDGAMQQQQQQRQQWHPVSGHRRLAQAGLADSSAAGSPATFSLDVTVGLVTRRTSQGFVVCPSKSAPRAVAQSFLSNLRLLMPPPERNSSTSQQLSCKKGSRRGPLWTEVLQFRLQYVAASDAAGRNFEAAIRALMQGGSDPEAVLCPQLSLQGGSPCAELDSAMFATNGQAATTSNIANVSVTRGTIGACTSKPGRVVPSGSWSCSVPVGSGKSCAIACDGNALLAGTPPVATCKAGSWSYSLANGSCIATYCYLASRTAVANSDDWVCDAPVAGVPAGVLAPGKRCRTTCKAGFQQGGGDLLTECQFGGVWSTVAGACSEIPRCNAAPTQLISGATWDCSPSVASPLAVGAVCSATCGDGFVATGAVTATCTGKDTWSTATGGCRARAACTTQPAGTVRYGSWSCPLPVDDRQTCSPTCAGNAKIPEQVANSMTATCVDGSWELPAESLAMRACSINSCFLSTLPSVGGISAADWSCNLPSADGRLPLAGSCTASCKPGFFLDPAAPDNKITSVCQDTGVFSPVNAACIQATACNKPPAPVNRGVWDCSLPLAHGASCSVKCDQNAVSSGLQTAMCNNGEWQVSTGACVVAGCVFPPPADASADSWTCRPAVSLVQGSSLVAVGGTCAADCQPGFMTPLGGAVQFSCGLDGTWQGSAGSSSCVKQCSAPPLVPFAESGVCGRDAPPFPSGSTKCSFACSAGFASSAPLSTSCVDGQWTTVGGACNPAGCSQVPAQQVSNAAGWNCDTGRPPYPPGSTCQLSCAFGFSLQGASSTSSCTAGNWSTTSVQCVATPSTGVCRAQPNVTVANGRWACPLPTLAGQPCTVTCNSGFVFSVGTTMTCASTGQWTPDTLQGTCLRTDAFRLADGALRAASGNCLDAGAAKAGGRLSVRTCQAGAASQQWRYFPGDLTLRPVYAAGLCLDVAGAATWPSSPAVLAACRPASAPSQQWAFDASRQALLPRHAPRFCLDISPSDGLLVIFPCASSSPTQQWGAAGRRQRTAAAASLAGAH